MVPRPGFRAAEKGDAEVPAQRKAALGIQFQFNVENVAVARVENMALPQARPGKPRITDQRQAAL